MLYFNTNVGATLSGRRRSWWFGRSVRHFPILSELHGAQQRSVPVDHIRLEPQPPMYDPLSPANPASGTC